MYDKSFILASIFICYCLYKNKENCSYLYDLNSRKFQRYIFCRDKESYFLQELSTGRYVLGNNSYCIDKKSKSILNIKIKDGIFYLLDRSFKNIAYGIIEEGRLLVRGIKQNRFTILIIK